MNWGILHSIATVAAMLAFFAIAWWAYSPKNKARFDEAAKLALDEESNASTNQTDSNTMTADAAQRKKLAETPNE